MGQAVLGVLVIAGYAVLGIIGLVLVIAALPIEIRAKGFGKVLNVSDLTVENAQGAVELDGSCLLGLLRLQGDVILGETTSPVGKKSKIRFKIAGLTVNKTGEKGKGVWGEKGPFKPGESESRPDERRSPQRRPGINKRDAEEKPKKRTRFSLENVKEFLAKEVRSTVLNAAKRLIRALHLRLEMDAEIGLPDPAYTGMAYAWSLSVLGALGFNGVRITPNFNQEVLGLDGSFSLWFSPLHVVWILGTFLFSRRIRPLWRKPKPERKKDKAKDEVLPQTMAPTSSR